MEVLCNKGFLKVVLNFYDQIYLILVVVKLMGMNLGYIGMYSIYLDQGVLVMKLLVKLDCFQMVDDGF